MDNKYLKYGLYIGGTITLLIIVYIIYKQFISVKADAANIATAIHEKTENSALAKAYSVDEKTIDDARDIADAAAKKMRTHKTTTFWDRLGIWTDAEVTDIFKRVQSANQMRALESFYKNNVTNAADLYTDLHQLLTSAHLKKIKFISIITK